MMKETFIFFKIQFTLKKVSILELFLQDKIEQ